MAPPKTPDQIADYLRKAADAYYNTGSPIMTDEEFDNMVDNLKKIAPEHPYFKEIGAPITGDQRKELLPFWMGSLDKIRDDNNAIQRFVKKYPIEFVISDKLDGISALIANNRMYTRGDGRYGQNITHLLHIINGIPLNNTDVPVRGEIIISKNNWDEINNLGANARNVVAGTLNAKKPNPTIIKYLEFVAYEHLTAKNMAKGLEELKNIGYNVVDYEIVKSSNITEEYLKNQLISRKKDSPYEIDGLVIFDNSKAHKRVEGKNPSHAFAFKTMATHDSIIATVDHIEWNASKDGLLKPIVWLENAMRLDGVDIKKATGHNAKFIKDNNIGPGARVMIIRSGGVIPKIERIIEAAPDGPEFPIEEYQWNESGVEIMLAQIDNNQEVKIKELTHFISKMGVNGIGQGLLEKVKASSIKELLTLKKADILKIPGFKETSANNFIKALGDIKKASILDWMVASNIFGAGLGSRKLQMIVDVHPIPKIPKKNELVTIPGVGEMTANAYLDGIEKFIKFIKDIPAEWRPTGPVGPQEDPAGPAWINGKIFVFTGFRDKELERKIVNSGGKVTSSVSSKTNYVVAGDINANSASIEIAKKNKIPIITRSNFD